MPRRSLERLRRVASVLLPLQWFDVRVLCWLGHLGMARYGPSFDSLDGVTLLLRSGGDLEDTGATAPDHRQELLVHILQLRAVSGGQGENLMLAMPPVTHTVLNRVEPWVGGLPFFYTALLLVYVGLIGILVWTLRRGV